MSNNDKTTFDKNVMKEEEQENIINLSDKRKIKMFNTALRDKRFLVGEVKKDAQGLEADWSHFDYLLSAHGKQVREAFSHNHLVGLKVFWSCLWEYLGPLLSNYEKVSENYTNSIQDLDDVISSHAYMRLKMDVFEKFIHEKLSKNHKKEFKRYFDAEKKKIDDKVKRLAESEKERQKEENRIKEEGPNKG